MSTSDAPAPADLLSLYDDALPQVYGYLLRRCPSASVAEDLTSETFLAAVDAVRRGTVPMLTTAWLVAVARNKLVDHWRREARRERNLHAVAGELDDSVAGPENGFDHEPARRTLQAISANHRAALTLRYLDGMSVPEVADRLGRTVHATEALLVRARHAFRERYEREGGAV